MTNRAVLIKWLLPPLLLLLLLLALLPELLRYSAQRIVAGQVQGPVAVEGAGFNIFTASASVEGLSIGAAAGGSPLTLDHLTIDLDWLALVQGQWIVEQLQIKGLGLAATENPEGVWDVVALVPAAEPSAASDVSPAAVPAVTVEALSLQNIRVEVASRTANGTLLLDSLQLDGFSLAQPQTAQLALKAHWNEAFLDLEASIVHDLVDLSQPSLEVDSQLTLSNFSHLLEPLRIDSKRFQAQLQINLSGAAEQLRYSAEAAINSEGLQVRQPSTAVKLLSWQSLALEKVSYDSRQNLTIGAVRVVELDVLAQPQVERGRYYTGSIAIDAITVAQDLISVASIAVQDGQYQPLLLEQGVLAIQAQLAQLGAESAAVLPPDVDQMPSPASEEVRSEPALLKIDRLSMTGDSFVHFTDQSLQPAGEQRLTINELVLSHLDQSQPLTRTDFALSGRLGEYSELQLSGTAKPFADPLALTLEGSVKAYELPSLSAYVEQVIGYHLRQGQYDHQFSVSTKGQKLRIENDLLLRQLQIEAVSGADDGGLGMPLAMSLDMLRDSDDNIRLKVPVEIALDGSELDISAVINSALGKALTSGATSFLKLTLQPYGAALMVAEMVGDTLASIKLDAMVFAAMDEQLGVQNLDYVEKIIALMSQRPALNLSLCGHSGSADRLALEQAERGADGVENTLQQLGKRRAEAVKRQLVAQGMGSERLLLCKGAHREEGEGAVELSL